MQIKNKQFYILSKLVSLLSTKFSTHRFSITNTTLFCVLCSSYNLYWIGLCGEWVKVAQVINRRSLNDLKMLILPSILPKIYAFLAQKASDMKESLRLLVKYVGLKINVNKTKLMQEHHLLCRSPKEHLKTKRAPVILDAS